MWNFLPCSEKEINLKLILSGGQSFRWKTSSEAPNIWFNVLHKKLWYLEQKDDGIYYKTVKSTCLSDNNKCINDDIADKKFLYDYFQLDIDISKLYEEWRRVDHNIKVLSDCNFYGIRVLKQDPVENLFSFICSQNNNIVRISQLVEKLCVFFGEKIVCDNKEVFCFPTVQALAVTGVEDTLRKLGFGYRAKFIHHAAKSIIEEHGNENWLFDLRNKSYEEAIQNLCSLPGVGAKVADCVCLMSLNKKNAIPVDTHMWQIASQYYMPHLKSNKTLTSKLYKDIGNFFRELYGEYAGWAHSVLFTTDLKKNKLMTKTSLLKIKPKRKSDKDRKTSKKKKLH
ncbi:N-glycosylase/DNA lyase isoform X2 [Hydra vulgaris]|uniref:DNA-(apurinic or apyrimidinic site) lyase n=1 Tax=Hydra vulgaris TaxID=6087 RepID=A0ABM4C4K3_HYDVU